MRRSPNILYDQVAISVLKFLKPQTAEKKYRTIVEEAVRLTGAKDGSIFLGARGVLHRVYSTTPTNLQLTPRKSGEVYSAFRKGQAKVLTKELLSVQHPEKKKITRSGILIPLTYEKKPIGVITLQRVRVVQMSDKDMKKLQFFGAVAGHAIIRTQLLQEMRKAIRSRNLFFSYVAHELRTPLTSILIYTHMMEKRHEKKKSIDKKWILVVKEESKRVQQMIDEFLSVEKYQAQEMKLRKAVISLTSVIERCLADFWLTSPEYHVQVKNTIKKNDFIVGDFNKLCQVVINLLNNAAKFSSPESTIYIHVYKRSPYRVVSIKDEGKGIAKNERPYIFKAFYKGKESTGKGIGLHIVKEIVDRHEGKIRVISKEGRGTTFEILLPAHSARQCARPTEHIKRRGRAPAMAPIRRRSSN